MDLQELREKHRDFILAKADEVGLTNVRIFGSVARGTAGPDSDLDVLVDLREKMGFFRFVKFQNALEDTFKIPVQVVTAEDLSPYFRDKVLNYAVPL